MANIFTQTFRPGEKRGAILVTGGAKRIGEEICLGLAQQGFDIALHFNHSQASAESLAKKIRNLKVQCEIFSQDLSQPKNAIKLIKQVKSVFPDLNTLINNASTFDRSTMKERNYANWDKHYHVNFKAAYILISEFAQFNESRNIINILDTHIVKNKISHVNYLLSKKLLWQLTGLAAYELAPAIRVNAIAPGFILPPPGTSISDTNRLKSQIPLKKQGSPADILQTALFLLNSPFITGQVIFVDGGEHLLAGN